MIHVKLTCIHHPELRWMCKEIAVNNRGQYNGSRSIFFLGIYNSNTKEYDKLDKNNKLIKECDCSPNDLHFAPEDKEDVH